MAGVYRTDPGSLPAAASSTAIGLAVPPPLPQRPGSLPAPASSAAIGPPSESMQARAVPPPLPQRSSPTGVEALAMCAETAAEARQYHASAMSAMLAAEAAAAVATRLPASMTSPARGAVVAPDDGGDCGGGSGGSGGSGVSGGSSSSPAAGLLPGRQRWGSVVGLAIGGKIGRHRLLCLKSNWVLLAWVIVGALGLIAAIIMAFLPCPPYEYLLVRNTTILRRNTTGELVCKVLAGNQTFVDVGLTGCPRLSDDPTWTEVCGPERLLSQTACSDDALVCVDWEDEVAGKCRRKTCSATQAFERTCIRSPVCRAVDGAVEPRRCRAMKKCLVPTDLSNIGGIASSGPAYTLVYAEDACPAISVCRYCLEQEASNPSGIRKRRATSPDGKSCPPGWGPNIITEAPLDGSNGEKSCKVVERAADFDGQLLLDFSGSLGPAWNKGENKGTNYFTEESLVASEVIATLADGFRGKGNAVRMGAFTWSSKVQLPAVAPMTTDLAGVRTAIEANSKRIPGGTTNYAPAISKCVNEVLDTTNGASANPSAYKMCMLLTDGDNDDWLGGADNTFVCTEQHCKTFCEVRKIQPEQCTLDAIVNAARSEGVKLINIFVSRPGAPAQKSWQWWLHCYSSCKTATEFPEPTQCREAFENNPAIRAGAAAAQERCPYFLEGSLSDRAKLVDELDKIVQTIVSEVAAVTDAVIPETEEITLEMETILGTAGELVPGGFANQTVADVDFKAVVTCGKWNWLWALLLLLPCVLYMLYFPCKRRRDMRKRHLRALLVHKYRAEKAQAAKAKHSVTEVEIASDVATGENTAKKYKWDIEHNDQYLWSTSTGYGMKVNYGCALPPSAPKQDISKKIFKTHSGRVLCGDEVVKAVEQLKEDDARGKRDKLAREAALADQLFSATGLEDYSEAEVEEAERMAANGQLGDDGEFWVRSCPCCRRVLETGYEEELRAREELLRVAQADDADARG